MTAPTIKPLDTEATDVHRLVTEQMQKHNLRLRPGQTVDSMIAEMGREGLTLKVEHGTLTGDVSGQTANLPRCFETFASKHDAAFFPRDVASGIASRDQLDRRGKSEFISQHGLAAFEALPRTAADAEPTELNPATLTRGEYVKLPLTVKAQCASAWGADGIAKVMGRK